MYVDCHDNAWSACTAGGSSTLQDSTGCAFTVVRALHLALPAVPRVPPPGVWQKAQGLVVVRLVVVVPQL